MTFTNIQICNISDKLRYEEIEKNIIKFKESNGYKLCNEKKEDCNVVKILNSINSKFITIYDNEYIFSSVKENKSYIYR